VATASSLITVALAAAAQTAAGSVATSRSAAWRLNIPASNTAPAAPDADPPLDAQRDGASPIPTTGPAKGEWCLTQERYIAHLHDQGINPATVTCAPDGPCDDPAARNASIPTIDTPIKTVRLSFHIFCENNGGNCATTPAAVDAAVARLNSDYAPWNIQFVYQTNSINSTRYRTLAFAEEFDMKRLYADSPATKLNIYVVSTPGGNWGTFPWDPDALTAQGGIVLNDFSSPSFVLTHEVGHCLGLWHTHHGVDEVPQCGDCYEAAGRSAADGDIAGDRCSDTNPSPRNDGHCSDPVDLDPCSGNPWLDTPYLNHMSYSYVCPIEFTPQQAGRMHCWTQDVLGGWLQAPMPPVAPGSPSLSKLSGGVVRIAWADNSNNEDGFLIQRERKQGGGWIETTIVADVGANTTAVNDSPGSGTFRYRVSAYNAIGQSAWSGWTQVKN
jgi:hypothetical protein